MDNQYTAQLLRRGRLLVKSHNFEEKKAQFFFLIYTFTSIHNFSGFRH